MIIVLIAVLVWVSLALAAAVWFAVQLTRLSRDNDEFSDWVVSDERGT